MKKFSLSIMIIIIIVLLIFYVCKMNQVIDNFENISLGNKHNNQAITSETNILLENSYPTIGKKGISNNNASDIWWHYPIFKLGSYDQITNNIRYSNNPDEGTCMPASMCGALYREKQLKSNYVKSLPPLNPTCGTRVGYFDTNINLLPFRTDLPNILY